MTGGSIGRLLGSLSDVRETGDGQWQARCPAHDDQRASLSISRLNGDDKIGVHCHANCATSDVLAAVGMKMSDLMPAKESRNGKAKIVATYDYRDADGTLEFQAVRFDPKDFRQRRPKDGGGWEWKVKGSKVVPYRLPELAAANASQTVFVVEGEKDADRLSKLGLVATCNAGGAGKWKAAHSQYLADRRVVILPDNDEAGRKHADQVARSLSDLAASIKIVALRGLPDKGDVSDWLDSGGTVDELMVLVEAADEWTPPAKKPAAKKRCDDEEEEEKKSTADKLVELALERYRIGRTETDEAFAVEIGGANVAIMFRSSRDALRSALARAYRLEYGRTPNSTALADALTALQGEAYAVEPEPVYLRVAEHDSNIIVDLGDASGQAVVISPGGWQVVDHAPVLFRRTAATGILPEPQPGGDLTELRVLLNVTAETWPLALGWLVSALVPNMPHPILLLAAC
jgi:5S rRNA maturation endonuclease (ribonuclease M5)